MNEAMSSPIGASRLPAILWLTLTLFIIYGGSIHFHFAYDQALVADKLSRLRLNPLISPDTGRRVSIPDLAQNIALFIPFGALGVMVLPPDVRERPRSSARRCSPPSLGAAIETLRALRTRANDVRVRRGERLEHY